LRLVGDILGTVTELGYDGDTGAVTDVECRLSEGDTESLQGARDQQLCAGALAVGREGRGVLAGRESAGIQREREALGLTAVQSDLAVDGASTGIERRCRRSRSAAGVCQGERGVNPSPPLDSRLGQFEVEHLESRRWTHHDLLLVGRVFGADRERVLALRLDTVEGHCLRDRLTGGNIRPGAVDSSERVGCHGKRESATLVADVGNGDVDCEFLAETEWGVGFDALDFEERSVFGLVDGHCSGVTPAGTTDCQRVRARVARTCLDVDGRVGRLARRERE